MLHQAAKNALEAMMANGTYEYQSDYARRYYGQGKAEGVAEGKAEGIARGKAEAWLVRALTATSAADVVAA